MDISQSLVNQGVQRRYRDGGRYFFYIVGHDPDDADLSFISSLEIWVEALI